MNEVYFHAVAYELPATPGGLLGPRWVLSHHCRSAGPRVEAGDLLSHAKAHAGAGETAGHRPGDCEPRTRRGSERVVRATGRAGTGGRHRWRR